MKAKGIVAGKATTAAGVALAWMAFYTLNELVFSQFAHSARANWIFLPAGLRILSVLLFDGAGVAGLMVGSFLTLPHPQSSDLPFELLLSASSALGPLIAVTLCRHYYRIASDLAGLRGRHIIALSVVGAAANSLLVNGCMVAAGRWHSEMKQIAVIFAGDMLGTAIMLLVIAALTALAAKVSKVK